MSINAQFFCDKNEIRTSCNNKIFLHVIAVKYFFTMVALSAVVHCKMCGLGVTALGRMYCTPYYVWKVGMLIGLKMVYVLLLQSSKAKSGVKQLVHLVCLSVCPKKVSWWLRNNLISIECYIWFCFYPSYWFPHKPNESVESENLMWTGVVVGTECAHFFTAMVWELLGAEVFLQQDMCGLV